MLDTGSYDLLIPDELCTSGCGSGQTFNGKKSKTYSSQPGRSDSVSFGTGIDTYNLDQNNLNSADGTWRRDTVTIGNVSVSSQEFLLCDSFGSFFAGAPFDGIMGFSTKGTSTAPSRKPWFWTAYAAGKFSSPAVSLYLPADQLTGGEMTFGGTNPARYTGDIHYIDTYTSTGAWVAPMPGLSVNGKPQNIKEKNALFDSGTAYMSIGDDMATSIYAGISPLIKKLNDLGDWGVDCDTIDQVAAEFTFTFGSGSKTFNATIPKSAFNLGPHKDFPGMCQTVLSSTNFGLTQFMIGAPLIKQYYTVWDGENNKLGFAQLKK